MAWWAEKNERQRPSLTLVLDKPQSFSPASDLPPSLARMLARADWHSPVIPVEGGYQPLVSRLLELTTAGAEDLPAAAVTRLADYGADEAAGWWMRADPVHLLADRDRLVLTHTGSSLNLAPIHAKQLAQEVLALFSADGWRLEAVHPHRWYLQLPNPPDISTTPLPMVVGRNIYPFLPRGPQGKAWHVVLNEVQTLLHGSSVNQAREMAGQLPVNSLWFWGGGYLPATRPRAKWQTIWANDPFVTGLARFSTSECRALPANAHTWLYQAEGGEHLLVLHDDQVQGGWTRLEQAWLQPLLEAVSQGRLAQLTVMDDKGGQARLTPRQARYRFWRQRRPAAVFYDR